MENYSYIGSMEIWKDIEEFKGLYQVSNLGNVRSLDMMVKHKGNHLQLKEGRVLNQHPNGKGYMRVSLLDKKRRVNRLVAQAFIPNPENKAEANHKDKNNKYMYVLLVLIKSTL
jgi:hypothetical protein